MDRILLLFILLSSSLLSCTHLQSKVVKDQHVQAQLISEDSSIQPGKPFWLAVILKMDKDWHTYWKNPGDSGTPTSIHWLLPQGWTASDIHWPYPSKIEQPPLTSYGYEGTILLLTKITPTLSEKLKTIAISARVNWLMCQVGCIPGHADLNIKLPMTNQTPQANSQWTQEFTKARSLLPLEHSDWQIKAQNNRHSITFQLTHSSKTNRQLSEIYFFPERDDVIDHAQKQILKQNKNSYELTVIRSLISSQPLTQIQGVLYSKEYPLFVNVPVSSAIKIKEENKPSLFLIIFFAFLGGLILNLMPCVLPVLSLKVLGLIRESGENKLKIRNGGLLFTLGVLVAFWTLAILLILLKAGGQQIGWGFQFQSPAFLILLCALFFILALNLFGVFEIFFPLNIQTPQKQSGYLSSFFNGILATLTATPCSAPFMGTALGFALTQSTIVVLLVFSFLGFGMAFPYLLLSFCPFLLKFLPKPGPWMISFKRFLGILLLGTIVWLLWVLGTQLNFIKEPSVSTGLKTQIEWQNYSPQLIEQLRKDKKIILIDFTAKWCLTCQVNERVTLDNPKVVKKLQQMNVATVKADWTLYDASITQALSQYGKNSIPLYVLYGKDSTQEPIILPELITPKIVLESLERITE